MLTMQPSQRFLLAGLASAGITANAARPIVQGRLSIGSFAAGWVPSELPLQTGLFQAALAAGLARSGGTRGWRGALGAAAFGASAAGLVHLHQRAGEASGVLEAALREGLGTDYRGRITEPFTPLDEAPITRQQLLRPDFGMRRRYRSGRGLSYGDHGLRNQLDVWKRADLPDDASAPVLLQIHGGAWVTGMKEGQGEPLMAHLAERGWVCVAANYRLSPRATWPDHIVDVKRALAWTKATIAQHGGDPDFVVITGGSAGGHLCSLAALTPNVADFQPGFEEVDTTVQAAVPFYGVYDFVNRHGTSRADMEGFLARAGVQVGARRATGPGGSRRRASATSARTRRRSSCCTATTTRSCRSSRPAPSSTSCARSRPTRWRTRRSPTPSTRSRCSRRSAPEPAPTPWSGSSP